ncbi:MAG: TIM barrel protein [Thermomicrobiales bacterium]
MLHNYGLNRVWEFAAEAGFDAVEVMIDAKWDTRQAAYLGRLIAAHGLPIASLHTPFRPIAGFGEDYPACVRRALALAREIGARTVVAHPETADGTDHGPWMIEQYDELSPAGGPVLAVENLPYVPVIKRTRQQIAVAGRSTDTRWSRWRGFRRSRLIRRILRRPMWIFSMRMVRCASGRGMCICQTSAGKEHRVPGQGSCTSISFSWRWRSRAMTR